ncbi:MAG: ArsA family ATPase [Deltaproteobacteria bacterium]|nr:ArsA family ATPase [Deltaproteobacteria bacterium]MBW1952272.1 ArsA family ATPase [Deltaproteobacteria bacterium]MBW1987062.1 ArsA family ATPase [Deltaproteobacteria bacterium]MBW2133979.1 ArsA family ATPase [Deltaproteobacteria bacterium]
MRIILFAGKGGVGKTSMAAATGVNIARRGQKTLVMSLDPAHSLADIFDLNRGLMDKNRGKPVAVDNDLWIQELDVQEEIKQNWGEVYRYLAILLNVSGFDEILAEELAILPGMDEVSALLYINKYIREQSYQVIILDCAPTGESLRFISIPTALEWYIKKIFHLERQIFKVVRPVARRMTTIPLPEDEYFAALQRLFDRLEGVDRLLADPNVTTVRLVTNPEKVVLKESQRAFMYFCLYQMVVDGVIINRIFPTALADHFFHYWKQNQEEYLELAHTRFAPVPIFPVEFFDREVVGLESLTRLSQAIYGDRQPEDILYRESPYRFEKSDGVYTLAIRLPFIGAEDVSLGKTGEELVIRVGGFKRHVLLPRNMAALEPQGAKFEGDYLNIRFGGVGDDRPA